MSTTELQLLREKLSKGFYEDNLYEMASICKRLTEDHVHAPAFYILRSLFLDIALDWHGRAIPVEEAIRVQQTLEMPLKEVLEALQGACSKESLFDSLAKLVAARMQAL